MTLRLHEGDPVAIFTDGFGLEGGPWTLSMDGSVVAFDGGALGDPSDAR